MYRYVAFVDNVIGQIEEEVASFDPERGGALLGPIGQPIITEFIYDQDAHTSGVTFQASRRLERMVRARESKDSRIEFKGILHSHPGNMAWPSHGDHRAYSDSLLGAPWLGRLVTPIVTVGTRPTESHEIALPSGTISVFITERRHGSESAVAVEPAAPHVLQFIRHLAAVADALGGKVRPFSYIDIDGQLYLSGVVELL